MITWNKFFKIREAKNAEIISKKNIFLENFLGFWWISKNNSMEKYWGRSLLEIGWLLGKSVCEFLGHFQDEPSGKVLKKSWRYFCQDFWINLLINFWDIYRKISIKFLDKFARKFMKESLGDFLNNSLRNSCGNSWKNPFKHSRGTFRKSSSENSWIIYRENCAKISGWILWWK